ncbi:LOW QUALITY PROTEIN: cytochrome P450 6a13 [Drosophila elegans]|uniref:LOW QUALITY PROTEIN: cytochrome P450 6a13 n=1 Tax=Drosophila elegans TaxID=30023 RepID=UPI001BC83E88|nr:LOW QUALITY PROTEIN: cytochrome P450 6a13 [Drosophila elegans]
MLLTLALLGVALFLAYSFYHNSYTYWARKGVPHERPLPVIGNMMGIGSKYHFRDINQRIYDQFKGKAPFAGMFMFFKRTAMITDLDLIKQVLIKDFHHFQDRGLFNNTRDDPLTGHLLTLEGDALDYRLKNGIKRNDFMDQLIELRAENQKAAKRGQGIDLSHGLTLEQMAAQAFVFFLAGFETSSSTMAFCLYELALQPDIQQKVRDEIESVLGQSEITYDALAEMTYLDQVLAETLRKHPIIAQLLRETNQSYNVPNTELIIEKGTTVLIPIHNIHHDADLYPEPERFDPTRFNPEEVKSRHPFSYLPFGDGPRNCIGLRFGKMQAKIGIVSLLRRFNFGVSKLTEIPLTLDTRSPTLSTKYGVHLKVERI